MAIITNQAGLITKEVVISKKDGGKYVPVGKVNIYIPTLAAFGFTEAAFKLDEKGIQVEDDGLPVYADDKAQYIFDAIVAAVKAKARNALVSGTADLKEGLKIAETLEEVMAQGERGPGGAEALAAIRELKKDFATWVASLKKSTAATAQIIGYFNNREALSLMVKDTKTKMESYVSAYIEQADEELLERGQKYIASVLEACKAVEAVEDF